MTLMVSEKGTDGRDRRESARKRTLKLGQIVFHHEQCVLDCHVFDLSEHGARIRSNDIFVCPERFTLRIKGGPTYTCTVVWERGQYIGVRFVDTSGTA